MFAVVIVSLLYYVIYALCRQQHNYIIGNVEGVLFHGSTTSYLTKSHDLRNDDEVKRIRDVDGIVIGQDNNMKVNGVLPTTRGLGECYIYDRTDTYSSQISFSMR